MKKAVLIVFILIILAVAGAAAYVAMMDWNQHKSKIAAQISNLTGKRVVFEGNVSMSILPSPTLSAENVKLYNSEGVYSQKPLAEVKKLEAQVSLGVLFSDSFDIKRIALKEPNLVFDIGDDRRLNWQGAKNKNPDINMREVDIALDSLTLEKATVQLIDEKDGIHTRLENLNAEVIAQNVSGPYRIEGSYTKGKNPEGFAISLGKIVEDMATSVNMVVNYPATQSYIRFDGTVFLENSNVLGSVVFESERPADFANEMSGEEIVPALYNQPLAVSAAINTNTAKIDLSNVVVKYGKTSGAGNVLIPLAGSGDDDHLVRPKIEFAFNMTDWDLEPAGEAVKALVQAYRGGKNYAPRTPFDLIGDVKALKAYYNGETLRDVVLSFDWVDNRLLVREMKAGLLADSSLSLKGSLEAQNGVPSYQAEASFATGEFDKLLKWAGYEVTPAVPATYQKATGKATLAGNLQQLQVSPYELSLDKSVFKGDAGFVFGDKVKSFIVLNTDSINFDNYITKLPANEAEKVFVRRLMYRLGNTPWLQSADLRIGFKADLAIFENMPLENVELAAVLENGTMTIERFRIANVANSSLSLKGGLTGLGSEPAWQGLGYQLTTNDFMSLCNKFEIRVPDINLQAMRRFSISGQLDGNEQQVALKADGRLENVDFKYDGNVVLNAPSPVFDGKIEVKAPDFVKMLNNFNIKYTPRAFSLGLFSLNAGLSGTLNNFKLSGAEAHIGSNLFEGDASLDRTSGRNVFNVNAKINRFELEQFLAEGSSASRINFKDGGSKTVEFLRRPYLSKDRIDYSFINGFDLTGRFDVASLSAWGRKFENAGFDFRLVNGSLNILNFKSGYNGGTLSGEVKLDAAAAPAASGKMTLTKQPVKGDFLAGSRYGLTEGNADVTATWSASAVSEEEFVSSLSATINFGVSQPVVRGWNLDDIAKDLDMRETADGFLEKVQENLQSGSSRFDKFSGTLVLDKGTFALQEAVFEKEKLQVDAKAEGSIVDWTGKADFEVLPADVQKGIPGYGFVLNGSLENPSLEVNVDAIIKMFNEKKARKEAEQKAREQARLNNLKQMMAAQQTRAVLMKRKLNDEVLPLYEQKLSVVGDEQAIKDLGVIKESIDEQLSALEEINTLAMTPEFDEQLVNDAASRNDKVEEVAAVYVAAINDVYDAGIRRRGQANDDKLKTLWQKVQDDYHHYETDFGGFSVRLEKIGSHLDLSKTPTVASLREVLAETKNRIGEAAAAASDSFKELGSAEKGVAAENAVKQQETYIRSVEQETEKMTKAAGDLFKEAEKLVQAEEAWYKSRELKEAQEKKVQENTSTISVDATGKTTTFVPDIKELEESEKTVEAEGIRVLDFSGRVSRDDTPQRPAEVRRSSGLVTQNKGTPAETGGTIVRE